MDKHTSRTVTLLPMLLGSAAVLLGLLVLIGWQFGIDSIKRILPSLICMNPLTALNFIVGGIALMLVARLHAPAGILPGMARALAAFLMMTGLIKLVACAGGPDLHIDHIMYPNDLLTGGPSMDGGHTHLPNNMAPNTALLFALAGASLLASSSRQRWLRISATLVALLMALQAVSAAIGYFNGVTSLYRPTAQVPIALHTIFGFLLLSVGLIAVNSGIVLRRVAGEEDNPIFAVQRKVTVGFTAALFVLAVIALVACASIRNFAAASRLDAQGKAELSPEDSLRSERITTGVIATGMLLAFSMVGVAGWVIRRDLAQRERIDLELRRARADADEANEAKSRFLANMSHEIRTPMAAIIGYADLILDASQTASDRHDYINTIRRNGEHLLTLINDVLDLSKIEAGKFQVERLDCCPCQVLSDVASLMRVRAVEKLIRLEVKNEGLIPAKVQTDPARLRQILINLVGNAIKFTEEGWVRLIMRLEDQPDRPPRLRFDVLDTGIGMSKDQISLLFQPFTQADGSVTRRFGGTGLGLTISKRLAEMLGGQIEVDSSPGRGSTFTLIIDPGPLVGVPRLKNCREALVGTSSPHEEHQYTQLRGRILLVDDGPDNRRLLSVYLREAGLIVSLAENGRTGCDDALAAVAHGEPFDVILMDMQMPEMDGYGAASYLRAKNYTRPIIALTAHAMAEDREKCLKAGCTDYLSKPVRRDQLISTIARHLPAKFITELPPAASPPVPVRRRDLPELPIRSELSDESLRPFLETYISELPDQVAQIRAMLAESNWKELGTRIHNLRGTGGLYGLMPLTDAAARVETLINAKASLEAITGEVNELISTIRRVEGYLEKPAAVPQ